MEANTQPCLTPVVTMNNSETSPPTLTIAIILVCRASNIGVNFSGHTYFLSSCHSPVIPTVSNTLLKSTNTMYSGRSCSMHFSWSSRRQNKYHINGVPVTSEATWCLRNYLWCYVGRYSVEEDPGEDLACYGKKRDSSIVPTICSVIFLVDGYNAGIL